MLRQLLRSIPALAAVLAVALAGAASFAIAGDDRGHADNHDGWHGKRVSGLDERWLMVHTETNLFEIAGGQAALEKATSDEVKALAAQIVADHQAALEQTTAVAQRLGIALPDEPAPLQQWALRAVNRFRGAKFDRWFTDLQVQGHKQAITEAETEVERGHNREVRALAAASLPVLREHLEHAEAVLAGLGR